MSDGQKCPFKSKERSEDCDKDKCVLWYEGGCAFVIIARHLEIISESARKHPMKF